MVGTSYPTMRTQKPRVHPSKVMGASSYFANVLVRFFTRFLSSTNLFTIRWNHFCSKSKFFYYPCRKDKRNELQLPLSSLFIILKRKNIYIYINSNKNILCTIHIYRVSILIAVICSNMEKCCVQNLHCIEGGHILYTHIFLYIHKFVRIKIFCV